MARERRTNWGGFGFGFSFSSGHCSYKRITLIVCSINIVIALYVLLSIYSSLYIYPNKFKVVKYTPDQIAKMEESIKIRRASEPIELVKLVKRLKHGFWREESVAELPQAIKRKITDEILQRWRGLRPNSTVSEQHDWLDYAVSGSKSASDYGCWNLSFLGIIFMMGNKLVETWRKEKLKEAKELARGEGLNSTLLQAEAEMLVKVLESNWAALFEDIGLWIPSEFINQEHDDKPEGAEDTEEEYQILAGRQLPLECHAELHTDYDGAAVQWGLTHHKESAADCCQACLDQAKRANPGEMKCNIWVYCPSETGCYSPDKYEHKHMECWLKYSEKPTLNFKDTYSEAYRNSHPNAPVIVPWVSGVVSAGPNFDQQNSG